MKTKDFIKGFLITFAVALLVNILVTLLWNYFIKSKGFTIDWETSFRMAFIFGIIIPLSQIRKK